MKKQEVQGIRGGVLIVVVTACLVSPRLAAAAAAGSAPDSRRLWQSTEAEDYTIDRKEVFEFTKKPTLERDGDRVTIRFASKDFCDATIVIEKQDGTILRHLASGVLGPNAPDPFQPNSLEQTVVWDGKNDEGAYVDDLADVQVRVSLGLKPRYERALFWHPKKPIAICRHPRAVAQPEGVYVYDGGGPETVKLFGHDGKYIRTVYPFPADKVKDVKGLGWRTLADGHRNPKHVGYWQATFLSTGSGMTTADWGTAARAFALHNGQIALIPGAVGRHTQESDLLLARFRTDGTTGDLALHGAKVVTSFPVHSAAFSPDGKRLYLTGAYMNMQAPFAAMPMRPEYRHGVYQMEYAGSEPPKLWLGGDAPGKGDKQFNHPSWVCVDAKGRVYIADNHNDRVQVYSPEGELLKTLPVQGPAVVEVHPKTQELYVFSWTMAAGHYCAGGIAYKLPAVLRVFEPFPGAALKWETPLPLENYQGMTYGLVSGTFTDEIPFRAALNGYSDPTTVWLVPGQAGASHLSQNFQVFEVQTNKLVRREVWNDEVCKAVAFWEPAFNQKLYVDPKTGFLYSAEIACGKATLIRIDPNTGKVGSVALPYGANDLAFDTQGHVLLRCDRLIGRFQLRDMREVPFDYGEERGAQYSSFTKGGQLRSAIVLPGNRSVNWQESGMGVNAKGDIAVSAVNSAPRGARAMGHYDRPAAIDMAGVKYVPDIYPGRHRYSDIHVFDKHGKPVRMDIAGQGSPNGHTTLMDSRGDIYFQTARARMYDGKPIEPLTGTLIKFKRNSGRFLAQGGAEIPLPDNLRPSGTPHLTGGFWVEDAEWIYPGAGFTRDSAPCNCWITQTGLDLLDRSFVPQYIRCQVAVLDRNGNLILQIGRYGNVDDGTPLVEDPPVRAQPPRSIGGDEVSLMFPNFVATHSDHRLFISDIANGRILSVKLDYHATERLPLTAK